MADSQVQMLSERIRHRSATAVELKRMYPPGTKLPPIVLAEKCLYSVASKTDFSKNLLPLLCQRYDVATVRSKRLGLESLPLHVRITVNMAFCWRRNLVKSAGVRSSLLNPRKATCSKEACTGGKILRVYRFHRLRHFLNTLNWA